MKVCIVSDSHDHIPLLEAAVADAKNLGAEAVLHCGDVVAPSTLHCLEKFGLPVITNAFVGFAAYLPRIIGAVVVAAGGVLLANLAGSSTERAARTAAAGNTSQSTVVDGFRARHAWRSPSFSSIGSVGQLQP